MAQSLQKAVKIVSWSLCVLIVALALVGFAHGFMDGFERRFG